jgi:prophage regulatory protein
MGFSKGEEMGEEKFIKWKCLRKLIGDPGRTTVWRWEKEGKFPRRRRLGGRSVAWLNSEIMEWIATRPQADAEE